MRKNRFWCELIFFFLVLVVECGRVILGDSGEEVEF